jgi:hypothetical protein
MRKFLFFVISASLAVGSFFVSTGNKITGKVVNKSSQIQKESQQPLLLTKSMTAFKLLASHASHSSHSSHASHASHYSSRFA